MLFRRDSEGILSGWHYQTGSLRPVNRLSPSDLAQEGKICGRCGVAYDLRPALNRMPVQMTIQHIGFESRQTRVADSIHFGKIGVKPLGKTISQELKLLLIIG